jgi:hypothetical protein
MLSKMITAIGSFFIMTLLAVAIAALIAMLGQWYMLQNQTQFIALSMGKYGGYTSEADRSMAEFISEKNLDPQRLDVEVSAIGPVHWGEPLSVTVRYRYLLGERFFPQPIEVPLTTKGRAVSSYLPGLFAGVSYQQPSW